MYIYIYIYGERQALYIYIERERETDRGHIELVRRLASLTIKIRLYTLYAYNHVAIHECVNNIYNYITYSTMIAQRKVCIIIVSP